VLPLTIGFNARDRQPAGDRGHHQAGEVRIMPDAVLTTEDVYKEVFIELARQSAQAEVEVDLLRDHLSNLQSYQTCASSAAACLRGYLDWMDAMHAAKEAMDASDHQLYNVATSLAMQKGLELAQAVSRNKNDRDIAF
jgi:hypothetical protein